MTVEVRKLYIPRQVKPQKSFQLSKKLRRLPSTCLYVKQERTPENRIRIQVLPPNQYQRNNEISPMIHNLGRKYLIVQPH